MTAELRALVEGDAAAADQVRDRVDEVMTITYHDTSGRDPGGRWRFASRIVDIERIDEVAV